jgi:hypothetical protein
MMGHAGADPTVEAEAGGWMVTVRLRGKEAMRAVVVGGLRETTRVQELLLRAAVALGVPAGAEGSLRCKARWLKVEEALTEAGVAAGDMVDLCVGEGGGMPGSSGVFASPDVRVAGELAEIMGSLLQQYSGDLSEIAIAVQRLRALQAETLALQQAAATFEVYVYARRSDGEGKREGGTAQR